MSPEQKRTVNTVSGGVFLAVAAVEWALAAYFAVTPAPPRPAPVNPVQTVDINSCRTTLGAMGYRVETVADTLQLFEPLSESPKAQLDKATLAASLCKTKVNAFCMGEGCEQPGLSFALMPQKLPAEKPKAAPGAGSASKAASANKPTPPAKKK